VTAEVTRFDTVHMTSSPYDQLCWQICSLRFKCCEDALRGRKTAPMGPQSLGSKRRGRSQNPSAPLVGLSRRIWLLWVKWYQHGSQKFMFPFTMQNLVAVVLTVYAYVGVLQKKVGPHEPSLIIRGHRKWRGCID